LGGYLDRILDAGFDGVYLDLVDAFEDWVPREEGDSGWPRAEQDMVDFVRAIADHARVTHGRTGATTPIRSGQTGTAALSPITSPR
jgi:cysteinyl-tRNA synthetase